MAKKTKSFLNINAFRLDKSAKKKTEGIDAPDNYIVIDPDIDLLVKDSPYMRDMIGPKKLKKHK